MAEIEALKAKHNIYKGWVTRSINLLEALLKEKVLSRSRIEVELELLKERQGKYEESLKDLCIALQDERLVSEEQDKAEKEVFDKIRKVRSEIFKIKSQPKNLNASTSSAVDTINTATNKVKVKLPYYEPTKFSGNPLEWLTFEDNFNLTIAENPDLDDRGKLAYLKKYLEDEPLKLVTGWTWAKNGNYERAMDALKRRYGREDVVKEHLIEKIYTLQSFSENDLAGARNLVDELSLYTGQLESLDVNVNEELGVAIILKTREKLPKQWRIEWARICENTDDPKEKNFVAMLNFLRKELRVQEEINRASSQKLSIGSVGSAHALNVEAKTFKNKKPKKKEKVECTFCQGNHRPRQCTANMSIKSKLEMIRSKKGCEICGILNHRSSDCKWTALKCDTCGNRHIRQLCQSSVESTSKSSRSNESAKKAVSSCLMRTASVVVNDKSATTILADTGGSRTFIRADIAKNVDANVIRTEKLQIEHFGGTTTDEFEIVEIELIGMATGERILIEAVCVPDLGTISFNLNDDIVQKTGSKYIPFALQKLDNNNLGILLGENYYDEVITGPTEKIGDNLKATPTKFGWMIHGGHNTQESSFRIKIMRTECKELQKFWALEHLGITDQEVSEGKESILKDVEFHENRYWIGWPWREELRPDANRDLAEARLKRLTSKLSVEDKKIYSDKISELELEEFIEKAPSEPQGHVSYLPHRAVIKESRETTKVRIVYDCSAKKKGGLSLNDCLKPGPSLLPKLFGLLLRFRRHEYGFVGDLVKAFLQIRLHETDRDVTRFLWDGNEYRSTSVLFGATSSPSILNCIVQHHLEQEIETKAFSKWILEKLQKDSYVDDCVSSLEKKKELVEFSDNSPKIFEKASMQMQKIRSSSKDIGDKSLTGQKVLGLNWNENEDSLSTDVPSAETLKTKRELASFLGKVYDPLGIISPFLTPLKIVLQDVWKEKLGWDDIFPKQIQEKVDVGIKYLSNSNNIKYARWVKSNSNLDDISLHCFVDSSQRIYAVVVYVRVQKQDEVYCTPLAAKAKLIPPKMGDVSFSPKFELLGCLLGSRLIQSIISEMNWQKVQVFFWTDSKVCLSWINAAPQKWEVYVRNRVRSIQTVPGKWLYVNTNDNPADIPTREEGVDLEKWMNGPKWLNEIPENWPKMDESELKLVEIESLKAKVIPKKENNDVIKEFVNPSTSKWNVLVGAVKRISKWFKKSSPSPSNIIFREVQKSMFHEEIELLREKKLLKNSSDIYSLNPYLDGEDLLRLGGRIHNAVTTTLPKEVIHPIILKRCPSVDLFILKIHEKNCHAGPAITLIELRRQGIWLVKGKKAVSCALKSCRICRRFQAAPFTPQSPPLPEPRVKFTRPFATTGVDLLGPLILEKEQKVWIALFTCFQIRAIHLELVYDLSEAAMNRALERFISRRGVPKTMWSDHGTNFIALSKTVEFDWKFIVERGPWWGGLWERLVGSVKSLLKKVIGRWKILNWELLETITVTIESVINKRPISFMWEGDTDNPVPLSPNDFLLFGDTDASEIDDKTIEDQVKAKEEWKQEIQQKWEREYLLSVLGNYGNIWKKSEPRTPVIGELVLVFIEGAKRQTWPTAIIKEIHYGGDGIVRAATVCFGKSTLVRPIRKLYPLELKQMNDDNEICEHEKCVRPKESIINWVQCDTCKKWYHMVCVGNPDTEEDYFCLKCEEMKN